MRFVDTSLPRSPGMHTAHYTLPACLRYRMPACLHLPALARSPAVARRTAATYTASGCPWHRPPRRRWPVATTIVMPPTTTVVTAQVAAQTLFELAQKRNLHHSANCSGKLRMHFSRSRESRSDSDVGAPQAAATCHVTGRPPLGWRHSMAWLYHGMAVPCSCVALRCPRTDSRELP